MIIRYDEDWVAKGKYQYRYILEQDKMKLAESDWYASMDECMSAARKHAFSLGDVSEIYPIMNEMVVYKRDIELSRIATMDNREMHTMYKGAAHH